MLQVDKTKKRYLGLTIFGRKAGCLSLVVIVLGMLILIVGFFIWAAHETKQQLDIGYGAIKSAEFVRLEVGDKVFSIPKNHIWSRGNWRGGKAGGVNLHALLPDFEPYTEINRHEFDRLGWGRKITLVLSQTDIYIKGKTSVSRLEHYKLMLEEGQEPTIESSLFSLMKVRGIKWAAEDEFYIGTLPNGDFYWVRCDLEGNSSFPSCQTDTSYSDYTKLHYTFAKRHLSEWIVIEKNVVKLINQFEINGKQGGIK